MDKKTMKQKSKSSGNLLMSRLNFNKNKNVDDKVIKIKFPLYNINESVIKHNKTEIERLTKLRDILLPKLMSGEIDVSKINFD